MTPDKETQKIGYDGTRLGWRLQGILGKLLAFAAAAVLLVSAIAISIAVFAVVMAGVLVFGGYIWWKTRALRRQLRESAAQGNGIQGEVIEGEVIRDEQPQNSKQR